MVLVRAAWAIGALSALATGKDFAISVDGTRLIDIQHKPALSEYYLLWILKSALRPA